MNHFAHLLTTPATTLATALALACAATPGWAFLGGDGEPMYIEADTVDIDDTKGEGVYKGSVEVKQGGTTILGTRMTTHQNDKNEVDKVVTTGNPATLVQDSSGNKKGMDAKAGRIEMLLDQDKIYFIGNASIKQTNTEFHGERIEYNTQTQAIHADKGKTDKRVRMTILPKKKSQ